ncbi:MAG: GFA family protein [Thiotrichaceae bacterium]
MTKKHFATGQCLCGKVKYTIASKPLYMGQCHCDDCRRTTGTGHASLAFFEKEHVQIEGKTHSYDSIADDKATITRHFCPNCGSGVYGTGSAFPHMIAITAGCLDDSSWFKAHGIVYSKKKPVWDMMDESIPTFEESAPSH